MRCLPPVDQRAVRLEMMDASRKHQEEVWGLAVLSRWGIPGKVLQKMAKSKQWEPVRKDDPLERAVSLCQPSFARH